MRSSVWLFMLIFLPLLTLGQTIVYDFEDGNLMAWTQFPENKWETSIANPLSGTQSLKHITTSLPTGVTYVDRISNPLPIWDGTQGSITWKFKLRHRTNPSGTNHWAVFLTSDVDAQGMVASGNPNGYVLGVNLTSTDDILRLYRVTNGVFNVILTSSINWETQIGSTLTSIGAIEIERKPDGTFSLKASTTGSFLDMTAQGSVLDDNHAFGGNFGFYFSYTSSAAGNLTIDEVSLAYKAINPNDNDALVLEPAQQVEGSIISSLETNPEEGVDIFSFVIQDQGTSDNLPTHPTRLRFNKVDSPLAVSFPEAIAGVILRNSIGEVPIVATSIMADAIELELDLDAIIVEDNSIEELTLSLYLKPDNIVDGSTIQLSISDSDHGWETDISGSDFAEAFPAPIISNVFTVQVIPSRLSFVSYPSQVVVNKPFNVSAHATDAVGNLATTYNSSGVEIEINQGIGQLMPSESLITSAISGVITWNNLSYNERDNFTLLASAIGLSSVESEAISVINNPTSHVVSPTSQPIGSAISSTKTTPGQAVEVFRFNIVDDGQFDEVPTYVRQLFLKRAAGSNMASFSSNIAGVVVKVNNQIVSTGNPHILTASISIPIPQDGLVVPDGEAVEVSISVYLRTSGLADGANLRFLVDSESHSFVADVEGSTFANIFTEQVMSDNFTVDVKATRLTFSSIPTNVGLESPFSIEVSAVDAGGSLDINAVDSVFISKNSGEGDLVIPTPRSILNAGKVSWSDLSYNIAQPFTILAAANDLNDVISPLIYCSDRNSTILQSELSLAEGQISALTVNPEDAVEVLRFRVSDLGTTDGLPTYITQMVFQSFGVPYSVPLSKSITGVVVWIDGELVTPLSISILSTSITATFDLGAITVPDGSTMDFSLGVYLKKGGQIDGSAVNLFVPATGHGWLTSSLGSGFPTSFDAGLIGTTFQVEVDATSMAFVEQPFIADPNLEISLKAAAVDIYGNVDADADSEVELSLEYGPGQFQLPSPITVFQNGIAEWSEIILESVGKFGFKSKATFDEQAEAFSEAIWCGIGVTCMIDENFNGGYPESFPNTEHWGVSSVSPISGTHSLKHALSGVGGESRLPIPLSVDNLGDSPMEWSFVMRNGNWDPTSDNTFWFVLSSDSSSIKLGDFNGYAVGVNLSGTSDLLTLWRVSKGGSSQVVVQSTFDWDESETVGIKVTRSPNGEWTLWYNPQFGVQTYRIAGKSIDTKHTRLKYFGPVFKYTSTRAGELWIDNLKICGTEYPPMIQNAILKNLTTIDVVFSSSINTEDAEQPANYKLFDADSNAYEVIEAFQNQENPLKVSLRTEQLPLRELLLIVEGIHSMDGNTVVNDSIAVGLGAAGTFGNVIINEIMSRPSPVVGLPNVEFIELFNRSSSAINLNGWRVRGNNSYVTIPNVSIEPNGYLILSGTSGAGAMSEFGAAVGISSFPTLLVGGMFLAIYDSNGNIISWVEYSDTWYQDNVKKAGGYSLERIDPNNLVEGKRNWIGSNDPTGGTPGRLNSVNASNPDATHPSVVAVKVIDATNLEIGFSEPMDSLSITLVHNYSISNGIGSPIWASSSGPKYNRVSLTLSSPLVSGEIYDICFDEAIIDFSGNAIETNCLTLALPEVPNFGDIIINEVLFNPYTGGVDFVEIFNRSDKPIDLNKVWIANRDRASLGLNEFYSASDSARLLLPNSYAVLTESPKLVEQFYYVENKDAMVWTRKMPAYPNDSGHVLILDEYGEVIDEFAYNEKMHNKLISNVKGVSLERINPEMVTNDPSSWQSAAQTSGFATPTARNSQFTEPSKGNDAFNLSSQVFSPDGDGFEDVLLISYELPESGYIANIMVFDSRGRRIKRLAANMPLGTSGSIKWDGSTDAGRRATIGAYVVFIEAFDLRGNVKRYKKTVVVASKLRN